MRRSNEGELGQMHLYFLFGTDTLVERMLFTVQGNNQNQRVQIPASTTQRRPTLCDLLPRETASFRPELPNPGRGLRERTPQKNSR